MKQALICIALMISAGLCGQPVLQLEIFSTDVPGNPLGLVNCDDERVFSIGQSGYIMIIGTDGVVQETPFLDIDDRVESDYNAHGLLGLVFHPDYIDNGFFYVNYINNEGNTVISRFSVSLDDPDLANPDSEEILLTVEQPYIVHKGGDLQFGPDGMLYVPLGDGGTFAPEYLGDPDNRSQNPLSYLGKMLRLDVDSGSPYAIPADNPYAVAIDTLPEIWAMGLRNPWRFSFDAETGDMWLSDVGQDEWEEVNFEEAGYAGGNNYGWRCYEGDVIYNPDSCDGFVDFTFPIHTYPHVDSIGGYSITGGYVYRGSENPGLYGKYLFCDYVTGNFFSLEADAPGTWISAVYPDILSEVVSFGEDASGELYAVVRATSTIYKVVDACSDLELESVITAADCFLGPVGSIEASVEGGTAPYSYIWSTGDMSASISGLESGIYDVTITDSLGCVIDSTFEVEQEGDFILDYTLSGDTIIASDIAGGTYTWYLDGTILPDEMANILLMEIPGTYTLVVTSAFSCADTIEVLFDPVAIEIVSEQTFTVYPNPADAVLYGTFGHDAMGGQLQILSPEGQQILVMEINRENIVLDIQSWPAGMYRLCLTKGNKKSSTSFVVQ